MMMTVTTPSANSSLFSAAVSLTRWRLFSLFLGFNLVTYAPYSLDNFFAVSGLLDLVAQVGHVDHDRLGADDGFLLPNALKNLIG